MHRIRSNVVLAEYPSICYQYSSSDERRVVPKEKSYTLRQFFGFREAMHRLLIVQHHLNFRVRDF